MVSLDNLLKWKVVMPEKRNLNLIDYIVLLVKHKRFFIFLIIITAVISYLSIFFLIEKQYDSTATILPSQDQSLDNVTGLLKNIKGLPLELPNFSSNTDVEMYNTIIYSRTFLENVINTFSLVQVYDLDTADKEYMEKAVKTLKNNIDVEQTNDLAFEITVRANSPKLSANITNYILDLLNKRIVELKIEKSRDNRVFLEDRIQEIKGNLSNVEDSMKIFQERTGIFKVDDQAMASFQEYANLDAQLAKKQIEESIYQKLYGKNSSVSMNAEIALKEFEEKLNKLKNSKDNNLLLSLKKLPRNALQYYRYYRNIEIYNTILEFVIPLYEQARFQEQKDVPVFQVIDYAVPPVKKSFPPRTIFTLLITFGVFIIGLFFILIKENDNWENDQKYKYIRENLFTWKVSKNN